MFSQCMITNLTLPNNAYETSSTFSNLTKRTCDTKRFDWSGGGKEVTSTRRQLELKSQALGDTNQKYKMGPEKEQNNVTQWHKKKGVTESSDTKQKLERGDNREGIKSEEHSIYVWSNESQYCAGSGCLDTQSSELYGNYGEIKSPFYNWVNKKFVLGK